MIELRPAVAADCELIFDWRNRPEIVALSSGQKTVTIEEHNAWFEAALVRKDVHIFVVTAGSDPIGQLRFDRGDDQRWWVSIYLLSDHLGHGYGTELLSQASETLESCCGERELWAKIREDNERSIASFSKAGFGEVDRQGGFVIMMTSHDPFATSISDYTALVELHGASPESAGWGSRDSQELRFRVLTEAIDFSGCSILDVGCGVGTFANYLANREIDCSYVGLDMTPSVVEAAHEANPGLDIRLGNILEADLGKFDIVVANGIFVYLGSDGPALMPKLITRMWELSKTTLAFTSISNRRSDREPQEFFADPAQTLAFAQTLTPFVTLRHDYHPGDFAIYMYRDQVQ